MGHLGYKRNTHRRPLTAYKTRVENLPTSVDLSPHAPAIFDQGPSGSCVGHARARGIAISRSTAGKPLPWVPSPAGIYTLARCYERDWGQPLTDSGCDPVDTLDAVRRWGIRPIQAPTPDGRYSDVDLATMNDEPRLDELEWSSELTLLDDFQISSTGDQRLNDVRAALAAGHAVCIDVAGGSNAWQNHAGGILTNPGERLDHYVCLVGYNRSVFDGHNSWGTSWGDEGAFLADESVILAAEDIIVCVAD